MKNRLVTWSSMTSHDLIKWRSWSQYVRAQNRLSRKSDGIGQTPCSYKHYLVIIIIIICEAFEVWCDLSKFIAELTSEKFKNSWTFCRNTTKTGVLHFWTTLQNDKFVDLPWQVWWWNDEHPPHSQSSHRHQSLVWCCL